MKNNISTKIISLLFAIFLWFYIIQVQNPEIEKTIRDIPVQFTKSELENRGLTLTNDKEVQIDVKIKGQRKHLSTIRKEDVAAVVVPKDDIVAKYDWETVEKLVKLGNVQPMFSLGGYKENNDKIRGEGCFDMVMKKMDMLIHILIFMKPLICLDFKIIMMSME